MKKILTAALFWLAFFSALMVLNVPVFIVLCSKCGMYENEGLYSLVVNAHLDFLDTLPGGAELWFFGLSPAIWLALWVVTGSPRVLPWKRSKQAGTQ